MSLRFRRSVRLFPGVRLNFSRGGISTTVGVRGASLTVGPRGTYANVGLPGTGLSYRTKVAPGPGAPAELLERPPEPGPTPTGVVEIASADVSTLTSGGLGELKRLINAAAVKRQQLTVLAALDRQRLHEASRRLAFAKGFIIRIFTRKALPRLTEAVAARTSNLDQTTAELEGCYVEVDFGFDDATLGSYAALVRSFEALAGCHRIWDVTAIAATNRVAERTLASHALSRTPVRFDFAVPEIVRTSQRAMRLGEASGRHIYLYPAFVMMHDTSSDFALIEYGEMELGFSASRFIEEEDVPPDAEVIGQTWKKANKDGSPDRRFADNYAIPIVKYGEIALRSPRGLNEGYQFSSYERAEVFSRAFAGHQRALRALAEAGHSGDLLLPAAAPPEPDLAEDVAPPRRPPDPAPSLMPDWIALVLVLLALGLGGRWALAHGSRFLTPPPAPAAAQPLPSAAPAQAQRPKHVRRRHGAAAQIRSPSTATETRPKPDGGAAPGGETSSPAPQPNEPPA
jgi:hypothetical protein